MTFVRALLLAACVGLCLQSTAGRAHEGHDDAAPPVPGLPGADVPRIEAQSALFEVVGVVRNGAMTLFVDRYATNEPVVDAKIDVEAGTAKGSAQASPDGTYAFRHVALTQPGQFPVTLTIVAGPVSDLLAADLVIADPAAVAAHADAGPWWKRWGWGAGALLLVAGIAVAWRSRRGRDRGVAR